MRIPSFNDFSPGILNKDIRPFLEAASLEGNDKVIERISQLTSWNQNSKRIGNIIITLRNTGLIEKGDPIRPTAFGISVKTAPSAEAAAGLFCAEIIKNQNGMKLIDAIILLKGRQQRITKESLQAALTNIGISNLSNNTTDHTTLKNWMVEAKILEPQAGGDLEVNNQVLKLLTGISFQEHDELEMLSPAQRTFLTVLYDRHGISDGPYSAADILSECKEIDPHSFANASFAQRVKQPLVDKGWIELMPLENHGRGGKSGFLQGTDKLLSIPSARIGKRDHSNIPADLREKVRTPLAQIREWLNSENINQGGLGLELLSLRIILDLGLTPREFRLRSKDSAHAEVDVTAEGAHLSFSRWTFQCKRIQSNKSVGLSEVAKEVGIAIYMKAHVIVMVSTGGFTKPAYDYAKEISITTPLQFLFLDGKVLQSYLTIGPSALSSYVRENAVRVMQEKRPQNAAPTASE